MIARASLLLALVAVACGGSSPAAEPPAPPPAADSTAPAGEPGATAARAAGDDNQPAPTTASGGATISADESARIEKFMGAVIAVVANGGGDCSAMSAPAIEQFDANAPWLGELSARVGQDQARAWTETRSELMEQFDVSMGTLADCAQNDPALAAAMQQMPPPPK